MVKLLPKTGEKMGNVQYMPKPKIQQTKIAVTKI